MVNTAHMYYVHKALSNSLINLCNIPYNQISGYMLYKVDCKFLGSYHTNKIRVNLFLENMFWSI